MTAQLICDIQATQNEPSARRGIGRYVTEHARALVRRGAVRSLLLNPLLQPPLALDRELCASGLVDWNTATSIRNACEQGPFVYHVMSPFEILSPPGTVVCPHAVRSGIPLAVTLYDLVPLAMADSYLDNAYKAARYHARLELLRAADVLLALSERSRFDAMEMLGIDGDRISVIGGGVSDMFRPSPAKDEAVRTIRAHLPEVRGPFVLSVVGADERKNVDGLLEAWARLPRTLRSSVQLVLAGKLHPDFTRRWKTRATTLGIAEEELVFTDWIPDPLLVALYQVAEVFVFPSFYEGFGLPIAEAIACDCPVITSNAPPVTEILNFAPSVFSADDTAAMATLIERAIIDDAFRDDLLNAGRRNAARHTWDAVAAKTLSAVSNVASAEWSLPRRRIALCGPFNGKRDEVGALNRRVAADLAHLSDVEAFWTDHTEPTPLGVDAQGWLPFKALGWIRNPASYDAVIYSWSRPAPCPYPGIVWQHGSDAPATPTRRTGAFRRGLAAIARRVFGRPAGEVIDPTPGLTFGMAPRAVAVTDSDERVATTPSARVLSGETSATIAQGLIDLVDDLAPVVDETARTAREDRCE